MKYPHLPFYPFWSYSRGKTGVSLPDPLTFPASAGDTAKPDAPPMSVPSFDVTGKIQRL